MKFVRAYFAENNACKPHGNASRRQYSVWHGSLNSYENWIILAAVMGVQSEPFIWPYIGYREGHVAFDWSRVHAASLANAWPATTNASEILLLR